MHFPLLRTMNVCGEETGGRWVSSFVHPKPPIDQVLPLEVRPLRVLGISKGRGMDALL